MKRLAVDAHLPIPWIFEPAKRPDDRTDCCLGCSSLPRLALQSELGANSGEISWDVSWWEV